jgi:hypothetical protein
MQEYLFRIDITPPKKKKLILCLKSEKKKKKIKNLPHLTSMIETRCNTILDDCD